MRTSMYIEPAGPRTCVFLREQGMKRVYKDDGIYFTGMSGCRYGLYRVTAAVLRALLEDQGHYFIYYRRKWEETVPTPVALCLGYTRIRLSAEPCVTQTDYQGLKSVA